MPHPRELPPPPGRAALTGHEVTFLPEGAGTIFSRAAVVAFVGLSDPPGQSLPSLRQLPVFPPRPDCAGPQGLGGGRAKGSLPAGVEELMLGVCAMTGGRLLVTNSFRLFQV